MRQSYQYRIIALLTLLTSSFSAFAQVKAVASIEIDTLTKVIGILLTIGGFFMGYMQMRMANKIAEVEAKFNKAISEVKEKFEVLLEKETEKLEGKNAKLSDDKRSVFLSTSLSEMMDNAESNTFKVIF